VQWSIAAVELRELEHSTGAAIWRSQPHALAVRIRMAAAAAQFRGCLAQMAAAVVFLALYRSVKWQANENPRRKHHELPGTQRASNWIALLGFIAMACAAGRSSLVSPARSRRSALVRRTRQATVGAAEQLVRPGVGAYM